MQLRKFKNASMMAISGLFACGVLLGDAGFDRPRPALLPKQPAPSSYKRFLFFIFSLHPLDCAMSLKNYYFALIIALLFMLSGPGFPGTLNAEEEAAASGAAGTPPIAQPFTIIISGTRSYSDIDSVRKGVQKIPTIQRFVETVSSQNHMQFTGVFTGDAGALIASIEGAASDRFEVQSKDDKTRGLVITLRKASKQAP